MATLDPSKFEQLVQLAMSDPSRQAMRSVIEKELLHFDILFALEREGLLDSLTFQGGTCLRLCMGAPRFSENLDFAGGRDFRTTDALQIKDCIEDYISRRYQLDVYVKLPKELKHDPRYAEIHVDKWMVAVETAPASRDLPKQKIKLEIANVPAYTPEPSRLHVHYPFLPDGYSDLLLMAESPNEIMADKLVSLVNTHRYVRHRDIWDLQWLKQQGATPDTNLVAKKLSDYSVVDYEDKARQLISRLPGIIHSPGFKNEMKRFLPSDTLARTLDKPRFSDFLAKELASIFNEVVVSMYGPESQTTGPEFRL